MANYQRNANQNDEISSPTCQNGYHQKNLQITNDEYGNNGGEKGNVLHCWWECKLVQSLWKTVPRFFIKLKIELPYDPAIPLLDIYPENKQKH